ncbi:patatin-like phospholipase family protein [Rhizobium gallicum]|uniref:patatin-like phospholipase family protein n=1 Tax=Rhizobium gallicum TaxID=56730 RepID=UPI001EF83A96|nr:patatin-like phospholipase family protein [Rhizobium gallicum]ULJ74423.1 patatin-like phospholipase family protein [Rhizobium gallicum]
MSLAPKIAIACQGGGSHAAFAAGVLSALLAPQFHERYHLIALSGTSGGAICAALVRSGLIRGGADEARRRLIDFWRDLEVNNILDAVANFWAVSSARLPVSAEVSPYLYSPVAEPRSRGLLTRHPRPCVIAARAPSSRESQAFDRGYGHHSRPQGGV